MSPTSAGSSPLARLHRQHLPLGPGAHQAGVATVAGHAGARHHGVDPVPVPLSVGQAFEHHDPRSLADQDPVGDLTERTDRAAGRQGPKLGEHAPQGQVVAMVDPARQHHISPPGAKLVHGLIHGDQRGGTGGVHRVGRALEVEAVGDARRRQVRHQPDRPLGAFGTEAVLELGLHRLDPVLVQARHQRSQRLHQLLGGAHPLVEAGHTVTQVSTSAQDHRHPPRVDPLVDVSGVGQGRSRSTEGDELVGFGRLHGHRHDAEGQGIEGDQVIHEATAVAVEAVGTFGVGVVEHRIPAVGRYLRDGIHPAGDVGPVGGQVGRAGVEAGHAHDGDAVVGTVRPAGPVRHRA